MQLDTDRAVKALNAILELELAGAVRYTQHSLMVFGHARIPVVGWMREQAAESLAHATQAGEEVTALGGKPSLGIAKLAGTYQEDIDAMLEEMLAHERKAIELYEELREIVSDRSVSLEEYARAMIRDEEHHVAEIQKMLRGRGVR